MLERLQAIIPLSAATALWLNLAGQSVKAGAVTPTLFFTAMVLVFSVAGLKSLKMKKWIYLIAKMPFV